MFIDEGTELLVSEWITGIDAIKVLCVWSWPYLGLWLYFNSINSAPHAGLNLFHMLLSWPMLFWKRSHLTERLRSQNRQFQPRSKYAYQYVWKYGLPIANNVIRFKRISKYPRQSNIGDWLLRISRKNGKKVLSCSSHYSLFWCLAMKLMKNTAVFWFWMHVILLIIYLYFYQ